MDRCPCTGAVGERAGNRRGTVCLFAGMVKQLQAGRLLGVQDGHRVVRGLPDGLAPVPSSLAGGVCAAGPPLSASGRQAVAYAPSRPRPPVRERAVAFCPTTPVTEVWTCATSGSQIARASSDAMSMNMAGLARPPGHPGRLGCQAACLARRTAYSPRRPTSRIGGGCMTDSYQWSLRVTAVANLDSARRQHSQTDQLG
jgi:hypothetical protein